MYPRRLPPIMALLVLLCGILPGSVPASAAPPARMAPARMAPDDNSAWWPVAPPPFSITRTSSIGGGVALRNGQALFFVRDSSAWAALRFDPVAGTWHRTASPPVGTHPADYAFAALAGGGALALVGGVSFGEPPIALIYGPEADSWRVAPSPGQPQTGSFGGSDITLTSLPDGRALATGQFVRGNAADLATPWAEVYDSATDRWTPVDPPREARSYYAAAALPGGQILVGGGGVGFPASATASATAERFDPATGRWTPVAPMSAPRAGRALPLADGSVLVLDAMAGNERYDPAADGWSPIAPVPVPVPRGAHNLRTATTLADGRVLVAGGRVDRNAPDCIQKCGNFAGLAQATIYDPATDRWLDGPPMAAARGEALAVPLTDGRVLIVGRDRDGPDTAEVYAPDAPARCFTETGFCIRGRFLDYWTANGGLARNGFPLGEERRELLEDGNEYTVQYFERVRLEYHPQNLPPYDVLLGQFGRVVFQKDFAYARGGIPGATRAEPIPGQTYFPETGHNLGGRFRDYWERNGGLAQLGYPLTEEFSIATTYRPVQYFERARLEYHPENDPPYDILLGQFGRQVLGSVEALKGDPGFYALYFTIPTVRDGLGLTNSAAVRVPGATQAFERGRMIWRGDTRQIYVLCGSDSEGLGIRRPSPAANTWDDTWQQGQDPGGGPAPVPGLSLPQHGFGKIWREHPEVRECLGYARTLGETAYTLRAQMFTFGELLSVEGPEGPGIYGFFYSRISSSACLNQPNCRPRYGRFPESVR